MPEDSSEIRIETPEGEVVANESDGGQSPQTIVAVSGDDIAWLVSLQTSGPNFVLHYMPDVTEPSLKDYDTAFRLWQLEKETHYTKQEVIQIIGGYLGNKCVSDFAMEWVVVTDEYGTDYAVRSTKVEVVSYPFSTVMKRIEDGNHGFIHGVYHTIRDTILNGDARQRN